MDNNQKNIEAMKKQKKAIIIVMASLVAFVALYFLVSMIDFDKLFAKEEPSGNDYIYFYDESLSQNILQDEKYLELNRSVSFAIAAWGTSHTILDQDDAAANGEAMNLMYHLIGYIMSGNKDGYNSCFSSEYYKNAEPVGRFTQQKIYNIVVTEVSKTEKTDADGNTYVEYYYTLEYMIRHNNGSLRNDMGSDCIKAQHIYLSDRYVEKGLDEVLIDKMFTINYVNP